MKRRLTALFLSLLIVFFGMFPGVTAKAATGTISTTAEVSQIQKYGNVELALKCTELLGAGYEYGDVLSVSFLGETLELPLCSNYSDVDSGNPGVFARQKDEFVLLAINMKDFATTYNVATKVTNPDNTVSWAPADGVTSTVKVTLSMKTKGGYYGEYLLHQLSYSDNREAYPNLTDAEFANFREVVTTGIAPGRLYRSASPINPEHNRNLYADAAIKRAGVTTIMNLADDVETAKSYKGFYASYYSLQKYRTLNMGVDFTADDFREKLAEGLRYFIERPGVYLVHCTEGKDRAGFVIGVLECLMGASYDEVVTDYMTTFYNYYGITKDDPRYDSVSKGNIVKSLQNAFGVNDLKSADLAAGAAGYLKSIGLSDEEIAALKNNLSAADATLPVVQPEPQDAETAEADQAPATITYIVKPGDSLMGIARTQLGDSKKWANIYELNKDSIADPNKIFAGQELKLAQ